MVLRELNILGSSSATEADVEEVLHLTAGGKIKYVRDTVYPAWLTAACEQTGQSFTGA